MRKLVVLMAGVLPILGGADLRAQEAQIEQGGAKILKFEIVAEDLGVDPTVTETNLLYLGPKALQFDSEVGESGAPLSSMVFRRQDQSYLILFHEVNEALVYDIEEFEEYTVKNEALQDRLWERLTEGQTPEEAEALRKMRASKRETGRLGQEAMRAGLELKKTDQTGEMDGHPWRKFQEFRSGTLSREFLVTPWSHLGVDNETSEIFDEIAAFDEQRREISKGMSRAPDSFEHYDEFDGFPLVVRQFDGAGNVVFTATVKSIEPVTNDEGLFENPGYAEEGLADRVRTLE
jgi:hypothetical protein